MRQRIEATLREVLGYAVPTLVLTPAELETAVRGNPYAADEPEFGRRMYVCFFEKTPRSEAVSAIQPLVTPAEQLVIRGRTGYALYAQGMGKAKLNSSVIERKLGLVTLRNWNTVNALRELVGSSV